MSMCERERGRGRGRGREGERERERERGGGEKDQIRVAEWLGTVTLVWEVCGFFL